QVELEPVRALELGLELARELAVRPQPRHLVLVLVGQELEVVAGHREREPLATGSALAFDLYHARDQRAVAAREPLALAADQEASAALHDLLERARGLARLRGTQRGARGGLHGGEVMGREAPPGERALVHLDRAGVELDRAVERGEPDRDPAALQGVAEQ